ncbi:MAG: hypothetical protein KDD41_04650 [Flavobacteriales bacterium]|nr:hypothetical protein [Flavobacteriales bacterium]
MRHPAVAALLGLLIGYLVVMGIETLAHFLFPVSVLLTPENLEAYMDQIPIGSKLMVILAHLLGGFVAVFTTLKLAKKRLPGYIIGALFLAFTVMNLVMIPHPVWFAIADVLLVVAGIAAAIKLVKIDQGEQ